MSDPKQYNLKHRHFVILGLLAEDPQGDHAYNINKKIDERGMRNWTNIGVDISLSTIYRILDRLENNRLLESFSEEVDNRPRKVYKLTNLGYSALKQKIYTVLKEFYGKEDEDFYVAYSMFPILTKEEQIEVFTHSLNKIKTHKKELEEMLKENAQYPMTITGLFKHPIMILQTDIEFLEWVLKEINEGKSELGPKAYNK